MRLLFPIILIIALLTLPLGIANADFIETMGGGIYHKDNPMTCIMEPEPELQERFYGSTNGVKDISDGLLTMTINVVYEWSSTMRDYTKNTPHFNPNGWNIPTTLIKYEDHFDKIVYDFPECKIFIEYSKENVGQHIPNENALGYTQIDFSKSKHQWAFVMIYLESIQIGQKVDLCIGCEGQEQKLELKVDLEPKPMSDESIRKILRHEYAHALGIGHYVEDVSEGNNIDSLMYPNFNPFKPNVYERIPVADREMLRQIYLNDGFGGLKGYEPTKLYLIEIIEGMLENQKSKLK